MILSDYLRKPLIFIKRQIEDLEKGGAVIFFRKLQTAILLFLAVPVVLIVRMIRPLLLIRFGCLHSSRIGHFALDTELYLCERDIEADRDQRRLDIFFYDHSPVCNKQLKKMWERMLHVSSFVYPAYKLCNRLRRYKQHVISLPPPIDFQGLLSRTQAHLFFTQDEERLGREELRKLGIPQEAFFVCFHARDSAYLATALPNVDWGYHDFRDASINNYIPAVEELGSRGYYAVRMGLAVKEILSNTSHQIIDYALNGRNDFMDIYLCANCRFFIGEPSGLSAVPMIFRKPLIDVNLIPIGNVNFVPYDLFIPKKLWLKNERRFMSFREIISSPVKYFFRSEQYTNMGIEVIENTSEEIAAVTIEMEERLNNRWKTTEEDEELQRRFWSFYDPMELNRAFICRIGAEFLRQNRELLELK